MNRILLLIAFSIMLFNNSLAASAALYEPESDELKIISQIKKSASPLLYEQLAEVRLKISAEEYENWRRSGSPAHLKKSIHYAASAGELSPEWDRPKALLGLIYTEFSQDREALELAAELLYEASVLNPANAPARLLLAQTLTKLGRFWSAIEVYKELFSESESMITGINTAPLAICYILDGRINAGVIYFSELRRKYPENDVLLIPYAVLARHSGKKDEAVKLLKSFRSDKKEAKEYVKELLVQWGKEDSDELR